MVVRGRVENGVVVFHPGASLPEGAEVWVGVCAEPAENGEELSEAECARIRQIMDRVAALPDENPGDRFRGADHDQALYGMPG